MKKALLILLTVMAVSPAFALDILAGNEVNSRGKEWDLSVMEWFYLKGTDGNYSHDGLDLRFAPGATLTWERREDRSHVTALSLSACAQVSFYGGAAGIAVGPVGMIARNGLDGDGGWAVDAGLKVSFQLSLGSCMRVVAEAELARRTTVKIGLGIAWCEASKP